MTASKRHALAMAATVLLAAVIAYLTLTPPRPESAPGLLSDKAYHVIAFTALVMPSSLLYARSLIWLIPAAILFGGAIELLQPHVGRDGDMADFIADIAGVVCGAVSGLMVRAGIIKRLGRRADA